MNDLINKYPTNYIEQRNRSHDEIAKVGSVLYINSFLGGKITVHKNVTDALNEWMANPHATTLEVKVINIIKKR